MRPDGSERPRIEFHAPAEGFPAQLCSVCSQRPCVARARWLYPPGRSAAAGQAEFYLCAQHVGDVERWGTDALEAEVGAKRRADARAARAPLVLPAGFLDTLGYPDPDRLVGTYWYAIGDTLVAYGPRRTVVWHLRSEAWLAWVGQPLVRHWLSEHFAEVGLSRGSVSHHLVLDRESNAAYLAAVGDARAMVARQTPAPTGD